MSGLPRYELRPFDSDGRQMATVFVRQASDGAARSSAGRLAKANGGPCDLARAGRGDWSRRYITTAYPSPHHATGFGFERLEA